MPATKTMNSNNVTKGLFYSSVDFPTLQEILYNTVCVNLEESQAGTSKQNDR
jgi:hypothetical protein